MVYWGNKKQNNQEVRIEGLVDDVTQLKNDVSVLQSNESEFITTAQLKVLAQCATYEDFIKAIKSL